LPDTPSYDARSTALALGSAEILDSVGAWRALAPHAAPIRHISVSHAGHFGAARLDATEENVAALGFVVENRRLGFSLLQALRETRVKIEAPAQISVAIRNGDGWRLVIDRAGQGGAADGQHGIPFDADLLVIADGAQSALREQLGIRARTHDYGATAIVCNVTPVEPHGDVAFERFTRDGALAVLPLTEERCAIVWTVPAARAEVLLGQEDAVFLAALAAEAGGRLGGFAKAGQRSAYPVATVSAVEQVVPGAVLLGNAAHLLHPVAGQGFNLTLRDAATLADTLAGSLREPVGDLALLERYAARRARDQQLTTGLSHGLPSLFTQQSPLLVAARDAGLLAFDLFRPLKREFARQAMGTGIFTGGTSRAG
ncbi:MAG: FAD-dependent monooxygenase, partial [Gammaproteobacteria bacterium]